MNTEQAGKLRAEFPPNAIGHLPRGGIMLDYVGHAATTDRLLAVDPEWSWEPMALDEQGLPALDQEGNLWIRLTVCGVTRPGVGDGKTAKERIGDAIRNAAMRFGVALDLWAKEDLQSQNGNEPASYSDQPGAHLVPAPESADPSSPAPQASLQGAGPAPTDKPLTLATAKRKMNAMVAQLREQGKITTENLYVALAKSRNLPVEDMIAVIDDARDAEGVLHWGALRETLTLAEARELHGRLARLWVNVQADVEAGV